jgi:hypothetical protein
VDPVDLVDSVGREDRVVVVADQSCDRKDEWNRPIGVPSITLPALTESPKAALRECHRAVPGDFLTVLGQLHSGLA